MLELQQTTQVIPAGSGWARIIAYIVPAASHKREKPHGNSMTEFLALLAALDPCVVWTSLVYMPVSGIMYIYMFHALKRLRNIKNYKHYVMFFFVLGSWHGLVFL